MTTQKADACDNYVTETGSVVMVTVISVTQKTRDANERDECSGLEVLWTHLLLPCIGDTGASGTSRLVIVRQRPVVLSSRLLESCGWTTRLHELSFPETDLETVDVPQTRPWPGMTTRTAAFQAMRILWAKSFQKHGVYCI